MEPVITVGGTIGSDDLTLQQISGTTFGLFNADGSQYGSSFQGGGGTLVVNLGFGDDVFHIGDGADQWNDIRR